MKLHFEVVRYTGEVGEPYISSVHKSLDLAIAAYQKAQAGGFYAVDVIENGRDVKNWQPLFGIANGFRFHVDENGSPVWEKELLHA